MTLPLRKLGASGLAFTSIGLGTWNMEKDPESSSAALREGIEAGANHIDTAEMYGDGEVEEIVGRALRGLRDKVRIVSKVLPSHARYNSVIAACERSLRRLKTDRLDVYLLHWREKDTPLDETFRALEDLQKTGKTRAWGVSNFSVREMEESVRLVGENKIACNQVLYHLNERAIEFDLMPWCRAHNVAVVAYSPFGQRRLPDNDALEEGSEAHKATPAQIALSFLTRDRNVIAIPKSSDPDRARENVRAGLLRLSATEIKRIDRAFPAKRRRGLPML